MLRRWLNAGFDYNWRRACVLYLLLLACMLVLWWASFTHLFSIWWYRDIYGYGLYVPIFVSYLLIKSWPGASHRPPKPDWVGAAIVTLLSVIWLLGAIAEAHILQHIALLLFPAALAFLTFGRKFVKQIHIPLALLIVALPFGDGLSEPLQLLTADAVIYILDVSGMLVSRDGVLIELSSGLYEIARACAGSRFFLASAATAFFLSLILYEKLSHRLTVILFGMSLPIVANILRVLTILLIAEWTDQSFAKDIDHIIYGWGFLSIVLIILIAVTFYFAPQEKAVDLGRDTFAGVSSKVRSTSFSAICLTTIVVLLMTSLVLPGSIPPRQIEGEFKFASCQYCAFRHLDNRTMTSAIPKLSADVASMATYRHGATIVQAIVSLYTEQYGQKGIIPDANHRIGRGWSNVPGSRQVINFNNHTKAVEILQKMGEKKRLVWEIQWTDGVMVTQTNSLKIRKALARLCRRPAEGGIVAFIVGVSGVAGAPGTLEQSRADLESFMEEVGMTILKDAQSVLVQPILPDEKHLCVA